MLRSTYRKLLELCPDFASSSQILLKPFKIPDRRVPSLANIVPRVYRPFSNFTTGSLPRSANDSRSGAINHRRGGREIGDLPCRYLISTAASVSPRKIDI